MSEAVDPSIKSRRPGNSAFKQQRLWAFQPVHTFKSTVIIYLFLLGVFLCFGLLLLLSALDVKEYSSRYDDKGNCEVTKWNLPQTCEVTIDVEEDMSAPVYFYYEMHNFYQNHRMYVKSRDDLQLAGRTDEGTSKKCTPIQSMDDVGARCYVEDPVDPTNPLSRKYYLCNSKGAPLTPDDYANPCGLVAKSLFNGTSSVDTYELTLANVNVPISNKDIAWKTDLDYVFAEADSPEKTWTDVENGKI